MSDGITSGPYKADPISLLIAESGSTKTQWRLCNAGNVVTSFRTTGFNPNVQSAEDMENNFYSAFLTHLGEIDLDILHFYGAGLGGESQREVVSRILQKLLPETQVFVSHDMLAAARSTGRDEGIVCILGTGSNSCYYKGGEILENLGGHSYLFGDEGSGADLGKHLIKGLLQDDYPDTIREIVEEQERLSIYDIKISVLQAPKPNVRLAGLSKIIDQLLLFDEIKEMVTNRFLAFLDTTVCRYPDYESLDVDFVGSVAFFFNEMLSDACKQRHVNMGRIIKDPVDGLVSYHMANLTSGN